MTTGAAGIVWSITLYVSGASPRSAAAIVTIREICDELAGQGILQIVDATERTEIAVNAGILAVPTLVKNSPPPRRQLVGDLSDHDRVRAGMDISRARSEFDPGHGDERLEE